MPANHRCEISIRKVASKFRFEHFIRRPAPMLCIGLMQAVEPLAFFQFLIQIYIVSILKQLIELLLICPMGMFHLAVHGESGEPSSAVRGTKAKSPGWCRGFQVSSPSIRMLWMLVCGSFGKKGSSCSSKPLALFFSSTFSLVHTSRCCC